MFQPLSDVVVVDLSRYLPGPFLTRVLADLGATVVKVEPPGGDPVRWMPPMVDGASSMFASLNAGKHSVVIDLRAEEGRELARALIERADVLVESFRPGVLDRLGLGPAALRARCPGLIIASLSGYGQDSSRRDAAGHDLDYVALTGLLSLQGPAGGVPAPPPLQVADVGGGAWPAAVGVLAALRERDRTGLGRHLDVSLMRGALSLGALAVGAAAGGEVPGPGAGLLTGAVPCYRTYAAADGAVVVAALEPQFWARLCEAVGLPHLAPYGLDAGPDGERAAAELGALLRTGTRAHWEAVVRGRDTCLEPVRDLADALDDPDLADALPRSGRHVVLRGDFGALRDLPPPGPVPGFGGSLAEVAARLGLPGDVVDRAAGAGAAR